MQKSGRGIPAGIAIAAGMISQQGRPSKAPSDSSHSSRTDSFDVRSFLNKSLPARKYVNFPKNKIIFETGDPAENVLFIEKGLVRLSVTSRMGKIAVLTMLNAGNFVGVWCLAGQALRTATVTAMAPTTASVIPRKQMVHLLKTHRAFSEYFISFLLKRNMQIAQHVVDLLFDATEKRLIRALLFLAQFGETKGDDSTLSMVPQELLAEMIGSTRTHVNAFMTKLKRMGLVEYNRGLLRIHRTPLTSLL